MVVTNPFNKTLLLEGRVGIAFFWPLDSNDRIHRIHRLQELMRDDRRWHKRHPKKLLWVRAVRIVMSLNEQPG